MFSKLVLKLDFNLLYIAEEDEWKTVFKTRYVLYEYTVMPFGLTNAPSTFQWHLNNILAEKIDWGITMYINNIYIYSETAEEHMELILWVLQKLIKHNLYINTESACSMYQKWSLWVFK